MTRPPGPPSLKVGQAPPPDLSTGPCATHANPELWFSDDMDDQDEAKRICHTCPVLDACLDEAQTMETARGAGYRYGIRGGLSGRQRYRRVINDARRAVSEAKEQPGTLAKAYPVTGRIAPALGGRRAS